MEVQITQMVSGLDDVHTEIVGVGSLTEVSVKSIRDAAERLLSGQDADAFYDGSDPYEGELHTVVDGWIVTGSSEGNLWLIHARRLDD